VAEKDLKRNKKKQTTLAQVFATLTVEDVFSFVRGAFLEIKAKRELVKEAFISCGYINQSPCRLGESIPSVNPQKEEVEPFLDEDSEGENENIEEKDEDRMEIEIEGIDEQGEIDEMEEEI